MNINFWNILICLFIILIPINFINAQIGLQPGTIGFTDSTIAKNKIKWQDLKDWHNYNKSELSLKYYNKNSIFDNNRYHPSNVMPKESWNIDYRSGSYYVPQMVRDELNLIMNRPKDNAFVPILGVAFIAAQMASKYLFVQDKLKINQDNVINAIDEYEVLKILWIKNPQTASRLYKNPNLAEKFTMKQLKQKLTILIDNKLVKQKNLKDQEMQYFPAITKSEYEQILQQVSADTTLDKLLNVKIQLILTD